MGCVLYKMVTSEEPFAGKSEPEVRLLKNQNL